MQYGIKEELANSTSDKNQESVNGGNIQAALNTVLQNQIQKCGI